MVLAILTTHPIQYQVPVWKALSARNNMPVRVFYMSDLGLENRFDPGFGRHLSWDIDLLTGYDFEFLNVHAGRSQDSFFWLRLGYNFKQILKNQGVRVLWVQGWQVAAYWQAIWQASRLGIEVWLRGETNNRSQGGGNLRTAKRLLLRQLLHRVDRFLSIGKVSRQFYLSQGIPSDQIFPAPYCVDNARFSGQASRLRSKRRALRRRWHIPDDAFCFLFVGKFVSKKRPGDLVSAARNLIGNGIVPSIHLLFVGTGALGDELRKSCDTVFDIEGHGGGREGPPASFAGFLNQTEISKAYVVADCLVLPSDSTETWGLVVNEAMASGLPCVASTACGCVEDLILPVDPRFAYPVGDVWYLQQSLQAVMKNPPSRKQLESQITHYDPVHTVKTAEQLYAKIPQARAI